MTSVGNEGGERGSGDGERGKREVGEIEREGGYERMTV